eukprot:MONOS_4811.1-p1 / transcript=MONOS_4811.1 / gene=MONOS_4811 / organism=Monocercomonoides_exilis_PA203 / gene_product=unspecified product / transcript_product=unspecified product / location=Mono_scaffold00133:77833-79274(-) / protein_length=224 / sequence_SO=supercontig / SO=protein_coding / is_pseudo=false
MFSLYQLWSCVVSVIPIPFNSQRKYQKLTIRPQNYQTSIKNSEKEMRDCYYNENECYRPIIRIMLFSVAQNSAPTLVVIIIFTYFAFSKTLHVGKAQSRAITSFRTLSNDSTASFYPSFRGDYTQGDVPFANDSTPLLQKEHEKKATEEENNNNNLDEVGYYFPFEGVLWKEFERENELHNNQTDDDGNFELDIKNFGCIFYLDLKILSQPYFFETYFCIFDL